MAGAHAERAHSAIGASSSERWMNCPGSVRLSAGIEDPGSSYAAEGTAAHQLAEKCLLTMEDAADFIGADIVVGNHTFEVDEEMASAVQVYVDYVRQHRADGARIEIEKRFDLSDKVHEGMFGTADCIAYYPAREELFVIDYKHGRGHAVDAEANPQLMYYAVGAAYAMKTPIKTVTVVIVQPRAHHKLGPIRAWSTGIVDLAEWVGVLRAAAQATKDPNAPLKPGDWCTFCRAKGLCPALRQAAIDAAQIEFTTIPEELTPQQISEILAKADLIEDFIAGVREYARRQAEAGVGIPGWKLVQKRAIRKWAGDDAYIADRLKVAFSLDEDRLYTRKLASPAQVEKMLPKKMKEALADFTVKESSGVTLARETDPREAVASGFAFQAIE